MAIRVAVSLLSLLCLAVPALADGIPISGRAVLSDGSPCSEAEVRLVPTRGEAVRAREAVDDAAEPEPAARTLTDRHGRYRLEAPHAGLWTVAVRKDGLVAAETRLQPLIEPVELPDARLALDEDIRVRVVDADNLPVSGASVVVRRDKRMRFLSSGRWNAPLRAGRTGDDGTVQLPRGEGESVAIAAIAPALAPGSLRSQRGTAATVRLDTGHATTLVVKDREGRPLSGVHLALGDGYLPAGSTDDRGRLETRLSRSRPTEAQWLAADGRSLAAHLEPARSEEKETRSFVLPDRASIDGRLIDAASRRPVPGGVVWEAEEAGAREAAVTDGSGGFELFGQPGSMVRIVAGAAGYLQADPLGHRLVEGATAPTIALRPAAAVEGRVLDADGSPVAGADVSLEERRDPGMMRIEIGGMVELPRARSDERGRYRLSPIDPDKRYTIKARAEGYAPAEREVSTLEPRQVQAGVDVAMERGRTLTGSLVGPDGEAVPDALVTLKPSRNMGGMGHMRLFGGGGDDPAFEAWSTRDGGFRVEGLPAGKHDLEVERAGFATKRVEGVELASDPGALDLGVIELQRGERVEGVVTGSGGEPLEGVEVLVRESGPGMMMMVIGPGGTGEEPTTVTDPTGWFSVGDLAPGDRYTLEFRRSGYVSETEGGIEVPRTEPLAVELRPASEVSGQVVDARGEPVPGADISLKRSQTIEMGGRAMKTMMMMSSSSDAEGRFRFEDQTPGPIGLSVTASGFRETELDHLEIPVGEDLDDLEIKLEAGAVVVGQVLAPDGRPVPDARVSPVTDSADPMMRFDAARTDGDGRYRLEGLDPGKVSVEATHDEHPRVVRDIELAEGVHTLDLVFEGGQEVSGSVVDSSGGPVAAAIVRLAPAGRVFGGPEARTGADGRFVLEGVRDGDYELWADAEGYASARGETRVTVAGESVPGLEVRLDRGSAVVGEITGVDPDDFRNVLVRAEGQGFHGLEGTGLDHRGEFRLENVAPGSYTIVAERSDTGATAKAPVEVTAGAPEVRVDLAFDPGLTLTGRVLQGSTPVDGAMLMLDGVDVDHSGWTDTGRDGGFRLEGLEPGGYRATVREFTTGLAHSETIELSTSREVTLRVPTARVAGVVTDSADRQPLVGVALTLEPEGGDPAGRLPAITAVTDSEGRFDMDGVAEGSWRLQARKGGYATASRQVGVQGASGVDSVAIAMDPTEGLTLETRLPSGAFPDQVRVAVIDPGGHALVGGTYATGESGRVRLTTVPPGRWRAVVSADGSATMTVNVEAPGPAVAVPLEPATRLQVSVPELADAVALATVRLTSSNGEPFHALSWMGQPRAEWPMRNGRTEVGSLPPGTWRVTVATADGRTWQGESTTSPERAAEIVLE